MKKSIFSKFSKALFALGLISQSGFTMEEQNSRDIVLKRTDTLREIYVNMDDKRADFEAVCRSWLKVANKYYKLENNKNNYITWEGCIHPLSPKIIFISRNLYNDLLKCNIYNNDEYDEYMEKDLFEKKSQKLLNLPYLPKETETYQKFEIIHSLGEQASVRFFNTDYGHLRRKVPQYEFSPLIEFLYYEKVLATGCENQLRHAGDDLMRKKEYEKAAKFYILSIGKNPFKADINVYNEVLKAYYEAKLDDKASEFLNQIILRVEKMKGEVKIDLYSIMSTLNHAGKCEEATEFYKKILKIKGEDAEVKDYTLLYFPFKRMKNHEKANEYMDIAIIKAEKSGSAYDWSWITQAFRIEGQYDEAIKYAKLGMKKTANDYERAFFTTFIAASYIELDNHGEANRYIQQSIDIVTTGKIQSPASSSIYTKLADCLSKVGRIEDAAKYKEMGKFL